MSGERVSGPGTVATFLISGQPGDSIIYARGAYLKAGAAAKSLRRAYNAGFIDFVQRRNGDDGFDYIAQMRRTRARIADPFPREQL
jgi:hypothetical protein